MEMWWWRKNNRNVEKRKKGKRVRKTLGPFIRGKIRRVLHRTRLKSDAKLPYKRHISSKIRRGLAKTRLILEQPLTPVLR